LNKKNAGFWIRFAAIVIDAFIIYIAVTVITVFLRQFKVYPQFMLSAIIFASFYSIILIGWKGQTIGKVLFGLTVRSVKDKPIGYFRSFLREVAGKIVSGIFFLLGFFWTAFSRTKQSWHDHIAQTKVVQDTSKSSRVLTFLVLVFFISIISVNPLRWYYNYKQMAVDIDNVVPTYSHRDPSVLVDVNSIESADLTPFIQWLNENAKDPLEYAVETAAKHQITIFGEIHWLKDNLAFLNRIIPDLYHRAGVTCIALEACLPEDNAKLATLVTSDEFDSELALEIARNGDPWKNWGWKGYWDVFETVWQVNKELPENKKKMRVVGVGIKFDGPSLALTGLGEFTVRSPAWEKLRIFTLFDDFARTLMGDGLYAANVARETVEKGERGVVLVGAAHSSTNSLWLGNQARMGFMLRDKYGNQVFQISFHNYPAISDEENKYLPVSHRLIQFIERVAFEQKPSPFGCDIKDSPFGTLRDNNAFHFKHQPGLCLYDITEGYICLKPVAEQTRCDWLNGYISEEMFAEHKNYYEAKTGKKLNSPEETDKAFSAYEGW